MTRGQATTVVLDALDSYQTILATDWRGGDEDAHDRGAAIARAIDVLWPPEDAA